MSSSSIDEMASSILEFQANIVRTTYRRKISPVDPDIPKVHDALDFIWQCARVEDNSQADGDSLIVSSNIVGGSGHGLGVTRGIRMNSEKWVKLGFGTEHIRQEFARVGMLGLDCLVSSSSSSSCPLVLSQDLNPYPRTWNRVRTSSNHSPHTTLNSSRWSF